MHSKLPLRARKKAKIRDSLIATSFRLFSERGYTETTLEEICEQCDVTVQTLLRYFGSKDDLLFAKHPQLLEKVSKGLQLAVKTKSSLGYWLKFLHAGAVTVRDNAEVAQSYRIIAGAPTLLARFYTIGRQYEALLEKALCDEIGVPSGGDVHATLLAHMVVMVPIHECLRVLARGELDSVVERSDCIVQYAVENFKRPRAKPARTAKFKRKPGRARPSARH